MKKYIVLICLAMMAALQACGTTGTGLLYIEPSVKQQDVAIRKVAVVPNRLPLNLQDPEKWRKYNFGVVKEEFTTRGFEVVDYESSVKTFEKSGLPVEDTKSSRDKYAELAQQLGVDAIVLPYYGTFGSSANFLFVNNTAFISVGTFQIFLTQKNDFFTRSDVSGKNQYTTGIGTVGGFVLLFASPPVGGIVIAAGTIFDLVQVLVPRDTRWQKAFKKGIQEGLKPFFVVYPAPRSTRLTEPQIVKESEPTPSSVSKSVFEK